MKKVLRISPFAVLCFFALSPVSSAATTVGHMCAGDIECNPSAHELCNNNSSGHNILIQDRNLGQCIVYPPAPSTQQSKSVNNLPSTYQSVKNLTDTQSSVNNKKTFLLNPIGTTDLMSLLQRVLQFVIYLGSIVIVVMLVYIGFLYVWARGNPGAISKAHNALLWTIIGALILLGSEAISLGIKATVEALSVGQ